MAKTIRVKAGANGRVPLPAPIQGKMWIEDEPVEVESSRYFRRRIEAGDLVLVEEGEGEEEDTLAPETFTPESVAAATGAADVHTSAPVRSTVRRPTTPPPERKE
jgi:hypothetical protein